MTSIKIFGVREEDIPYIKAWSTKHSVTVDLDEALLSSETVDRAKGFDGVSISQQIPLVKMYIASCMNLELSKLLNEVLVLIYMISI